MTETSLTTDRILDAAEEVLRRFGPAKTTVVDVARALDVSHGTIYRYYPSKAALRDAVAERWLHRVAAPLEQIAHSEGAPVEQLRAWLDRLIALKRQKSFNDPELFTLYNSLAEQAGAAVDVHVAELIGHLALIIGRGVQQGVFAVPDVQAAARGVFSATAKFHHPALAANWRDPLIDADFAEVWRLLLSGLVNG
ncbi:MAG: TetR family transcriptional regulator [Roseiflexaceae bacterium]